MKLFLIFAFLFSSANLYAAEKSSASSSVVWGQVGHYVTGQLADYHMTDQARERVKEILGDRSIARATVWMDDIRNDSHYDYTRTWHWATIPDGMTYEEAEDIQEEDGNIVWALEKLIDQLKEGGLTEREERDKLKKVMHMVGDIHQPLHVGTGEDRGGNDVRVQWMGSNSNLHRVWDSDIINSFQMSFRELADEVNVTDPDLIAEWQSATVRDWAHESMTYRDRIYDLPDNNRLGFQYRWDNKDIVFERLAQAGIRLAGVLNDIYGE